MRIGIGLGLGFSQHTPAAAAVLDLSTLAWTAWWNGDNYSSGTATGIASAGASGSRNVTEATNKPTTGNAVNGHAGIIFNGVNQQLNTASLMSDLITTTAWTIYLVVNVNAFTGGAGSPGYTLPSVLTDSGSYWAQGAIDGQPGTGTDGRLCAYSLTTGGEKTARNPTTKQTIHLVECLYDGTNESISIDGAAPTTLAATALNSSALAGTVRMGCNYNQGVRYNGTIYEVLATNTALGSTTRSSVRGALASKFGQAWT